MIAALVEEVVRLVEADRVGVWLCTEGSDPRLARAHGAAAAAADPPPIVLRSARTVKRTMDPGGAACATPIVGPRAGLMGVLEVACVHPSEASLAIVAELAEEAGFGLEAATLYEAAVAEKERTEAILGRVGDAIVVTDAGGRVRRWNQQAERYFGRTEAEAVGEPCAAMLALTAGERVLDCASGCALLQHAQGATLGIDVERVAADGRSQPLSANVTAITATDGAIYEVVHSLRDVTRMKQADEAKTMFLATASHELRTPLTVIQGFAQLLSSDRASEVDRASAAEAIDRRARQLNGIIERLLLSSRIEAGRADVRTVPTDLRPILLEEVASTAAARSRTITADVPPSLPEATADPEAVRTVLQHLLDNAITYSPDGGSILVRASADAEHVLFEVTDDGIGMDDEQAARCFDRFWQAESSDVRRYGGTGIGLYIVRSLMEGMGGNVVVRSARGSGSTFTCTFARAGVVPVPTPESREPDGIVTPEPSVIREFMRQMGIPRRSA